MAVWNICVGSIQLGRLGIAVFILFGGIGCASFEPRPLDEVPFMERAVTKTDGPLRVTAAVLSAEECKEAFDLDLYGEGIQPIWLEIENKSAEEHWFLRRGLDHDYFAPLEVAYINRYSFSSDANSKMEQFFYEHGLGNIIPPGGTSSGFVFTNLDKGTKSFNVDIIGMDQQIRTFTFFIPVPGLRIDHREIDFDSLYAVDEIVRYTPEEEQAFRKALAALPCCSTSKDGTEMGDPLNIVVLGGEKSDDVYHAFMRAGWDET